MRLGWLLILPFLFSFSFSPMTETLDVSETDKVTFQIDNPTQKPIPVLITVKERVQLLDGKEKLPDTSLIEAFPPQVIVPPKDKRSIKIKWKGKKELKGEKSFRVIAEQVPLNLDENKKSGIQMLLKYQAALYVDNGKSKSNLEIKSFKQAKVLKVTISNKGNKHQYLKNVKIFFEKKDKRLELAMRELKQLEGQNILANSTRVFEFAPLKDLDASYKGHLSFDK
mgnify:CR=1 FL=1